MQKLKDAKKIKWTESYTEKSGFLKDQFNAVVGKGSYKRFEGREIGGPGEWYAVVSPADVHEHKRAKFFAGVRKLPDSYPAGGKYFDTIKEAYEYAFDTWGVPKPHEIPHYTSGDLKGISKRIDKWKRHKEQQEQQEEITASIPFDIFRIREAMGQEAVFKDDIVFDFKIFIPLLQDVNFNSPEASDVVYSKVLDAAGYSSPDEVLEELGEKEKMFSEYGVTVTPGGQRKEWKEENKGLAKAKDDLSKDPKNIRNPDEQTEMFRLAAKAMTIGRKKRREIFTTLYKKPGTFKNVGLENIDRRALRSNFEEALFSLYGRYLENVENVRRFYDFSIYMYKRYSEQFKPTRGKTLVQMLNFEKGKEEPSKPETIPTIPEERKLTLEEFRDKLRSTDPKDQEFRERWSFSPDKFPIRAFITYSRRDSACRYCLSAPYTSERSFSNRYSIIDNSFRKDKNGFDQVDYALIYAKYGKRMEDFISRVSEEVPEGLTPEQIEQRNKRKEIEEKRIAELLQSSRTFISSLSDIPDKIRNLIRVKQIKAPGIPGGKIPAMSVNLTSKQFTELLDDIIDKIIRSRVDSYQLKKGFRDVFRGWGKYIRGNVVIERDINQRVEAKRFGAFYFGKKDVHDKVSSGEIVQLFQKQSSGLFSDKPVPISGVEIALTSFKGYAGLSGEEQSKIDSLISSLKSFTENKKNFVTFDEFNNLIRELDLRNVFRRDDILYLFSQALKIGGQIPTIYVDEQGNEEGIHTTITRDLKQKIKAMDLSDLGSLSPAQRAILAYDRRANKDLQVALGWVGKVSRREGAKMEELISSIKLTRILRDQTEDVDGKRVRVFSDDYIKRLISRLANRMAEKSFDSYINLVDSSDVVLGTFTNADRVEISRLTFTDFAYWKILKDKFRNKWSLLERNPALYEAILRTFFVPGKIRESIEKLNVPIFFSKTEKDESGSPKRVTTDSEGNQLLYRDGKIVVKKEMKYKKGKQTGETKEIVFVPPDNVDDISITFTLSPAETIRQIEDLIEKYFSTCKVEPVVRLLNNLKSEGIDSSSIDSLIANLGQLEDIDFKTFSEMALKSNLGDILEREDVIYLFAENKRNYVLTDSFVEYRPDNSPRSSLPVRNFGSNKFVERLVSLGRVQERVLLEIFKDMANGTMLPPDVSSPEEMTPEHTAMLASLKEKIEGIKKVRKGKGEEKVREFTSKEFDTMFERAKSTVDEFYRRRGDHPYTVDRYDSDYRTQISASGVVNLTASLGFYVFRDVSGADVKEGKKAKKRVQSDLDFTKNPKNAALITNLPYGIFCDRAAQSVNVPKNVAFSEEELEDATSEIIGRINSEDLAVAFASRFNRAATTEEEIAKFASAFSNASLSRESLVGLLRKAVPKRENNGLIYEYDPLISRTKKENDAIVWYKAWRDPDYGQATFIVTANYLLAWIHEGSVGREMLAKILGIDIGGDTGGAGTIDDIISKAVDSVKILENVVKEIPINPKDTQKQEQEAESVVDNTATEGKESTDNQEERDREEAEENEQNNKSVPVSEAKDKPTVTEPAVEPTEEAKAEPSATEPPVTEPSVTEPPVAEPPVAEPVTTEPSAAEPTEEGEKPKPTITRKRRPLPSTPTGIGEEPLTELEPKQEPVKIVRRRPPSLPRPLVSTPSMWEEETSESGEVSEDKKKLRPKRKPIVQVTPGKKSDESDKKSKSLLNLVRVANIFYERNKIDEADAIVEYVRENIESESDNESMRKIAIIQALSNLVSVSKTMIKRGKVEEAEEINKIIKKHIGTIASSEQGT